MFTIKKGPTLLWSVTTAVQRTNDRVNGITGVNPVVIEDFYRFGIIEVKIITSVNLTLTDLTIFCSLTGTTGSTTVSFPAPADNTRCLARPIVTSVPALVAGQGTTVIAVPPSGNTNIGLFWSAIPPALCLEYSTSAAGATPNLVFEVRGVFFGNPYYNNIP